MGEGYGPWHDEYADRAAAISGTGRSAAPTFKLSRPQFEVYEDPHRFRVLVAGRRFGKTHLAIPELERFARGPGKLAWYVAPTYKQAKMITWAKLKTMLHPWIIKRNESELSVVLSTGGTIRLHGADNYDSLRGPGLDGLVLDEYADIAQEAWTEVLRPMLSDRLGKALFIGTPKGFNHFYDLVKAAKDGARDWAAYQFTTLQGGRVAASEIEAARDDLDLRTFQQEYEASFENASGRVYYCFDRADHVEPRQFNPRQRLCWALDFNIDPMSSLMFQVEHDGYGGPVGDVTVNVFDELSLRSFRTQDAVEEFKKRVRKLQPHGEVQVNVYGDPAGNQRQHAGPSDWAAVWDGLRGSGIRGFDMVEKAQPGVRDRVNATNSMLKNASGAVRMKIDPRCKELIKDLEQCVWVEDRNGNSIGEISQKGGRSHMAVALSYAMLVEFGANAVRTGPSSQVIG